MTNFHAVGINEYFLELHIQIMKECTLSLMIVPGQSGDDPVLQPGDYSYPFQFLIPNQNMPTSVEGRHGYIRYWLKGIIDRPWRFDITTTAVFTMLEYVDINTFPLLVSQFCC